MMLTGRSALVTGGASGLGAACARMLAAHQASVIIVDRDEDRGLALASETGGRFIPADVADEFAMQLAFADVEDLAVAISCAGIATGERVVGREGPASLDAFSKVVRVNLIGTFNTVRLAASRMAANEPDEHGQRGVIINTASIAAFDGQIGQAAYAASKGGIVGMTLPLARDLARHGIRVVTIAPGTFDTPLMQQFSAEVRGQLGQQTPFPSRLGNPSEFAFLAAHIIANPMLNGETIRLDGALRMPPR